MTKTKFVLFFQLLAVITGGVDCGNYFACSKNNCQQGGQCLVMSASPSSLSYSSVIDSVDFFVADPSGQDWYSAAKTCAELPDTTLFEPSPSPVLEAAQDFIEEYLSSHPPIDEVIIAGFWTGIQPDDSMCTLWDLSTGSMVSNVACNSTSTNQNAVYIGLCQHKMEADNLVQPYYYTCQCVEGYGYENCEQKDSEAGQTVDRYHTYCQSEETDIELMSDGDKLPIIFIDHVAFGRPFYLEGSLSGTAAMTCKRNLYATEPNEYCVAANALAAVTYWCQGKKRCKFRTYMLYDLGGKAKQFYALNAAQPVKDYLEAAKGCASDGSSLAVIKNKADAARVEERLSKLFSRQINQTELPSDGFWVDSSTERHFHKLGILGVSGKSVGSCLLLMPNKYVGLGRLQFKWESCFGTEKEYGALCESTFGLGGRNKKITTGVDPEDTECLFQSQSPKVFEYRYHLGHDLNRRDISCPMKVNYRRGIIVDDEPTTPTTSTTSTTPPPACWCEGADFEMGNTCYKKTDVRLDWSAARRKCWEWGGELAFPLPESENECAAPIFTMDREELWLAGTQSCGEARCPIAFDNNNYFIEGAYDSSNDLCFPNITVDQDCYMTGKCDKARKGLCALPPAMQPRTQLPPADTCPMVQPGTDGWPFPHYAWNEEGQVGGLSVQPCPEGQQGNATWECGLDGHWIDFPDLSNCSNIDTDAALRELARNDSVPSDVIKKLHSNVSDESSIGAGDIKAIIDVLQVALEYQNERAQHAPDPSSYADEYTKESVDLLDEVLERPESWFGIPQLSKQQELSKLQDNLDNVAKSLIKFSTKNIHDYVAKNLVVQVLRQANAEGGQAFQNEQNTIEVSTLSQGHKSISFYAFPNFGCILNSLYDCDYPINATDALNTAVMGATLYDSNGEISQNNGFSNISVLLHLKNNLEGSQYNISEPTCVFWDVNANDWSGEDCFVLDFDDTFTRCQCFHLTNFGVILDINGNLDDPELEFLNALLTWVTIFGCALSIISLIICIYVFTVVGGLRGDRTTIHRNLCICLLLAELLLVSGLDATDSPALCGVIAGFLHYLFLASFAWMFVEGIHVYFMLVKVFDTGRSMVWLFYLIGYGSPAVIVLLSALIVETSGTHGYGTDTHCWLDWENGLIWAFGAPVMFVLVVNTAMFVKALVIARRSMQKRQTADNSSNTLTLIKGSFSLLCILGLTWLLGFTYFADGSEWLAVIFALLNSLQGVFIFFFHVLINDKAKQEFTRHVRHTVVKARSYLLKKPMDPKLYKDSTSDQTGSATSRGISSSTSNNRKISNDATMSTDVKSDGSSQVKYYRGQVTMTVTGVPSRGPSPTGAIAESKDE